MVFCQSGVAEERNELVKIGIRDTRLLRGILLTDHLLTHENLDVRIKGGLPLLGTQVQVLLKAVKLSLVNALYHPKGSLVENV